MASRTIHFVFSLRRLICSRPLPYTSALFTRRRSLRGIGAGTSKRSGASVLNGWCAQKSWHEFLSDLCSSASLGSQNSDALWSDSDHDRSWRRLLIYGASILGLRSAARSANYWTWLALSATKFMEYQSESLFLRVPRAICWYHLMVARYRLWYSSFASLHQMPERRLSTQNCLPPSTKKVQSLLDRLLGQNSDQKSFQCRSRHR